MSYRKNSVRGSIAGVALLVAAGVNGAGCSNAFPGGSVSDNVFTAIVLLSGERFAISPSSGVTVNAGATYKFSASNARGTVSFEVSGCSGASIDSTGLLTAPTTSGTCTVTATDTSSLGVRTASVTASVSTLPDSITSNANLYAYFRFEGNVTGSSANAFVPVMGGAVTYASTNTPLSSTVYATNQKGIFNGATDLMFAGFDPSTSTNGISVEAWFRLTNPDALMVTGARVIVGQDNGCGAGRAWLGIDTGTTDNISTQLGGTSLGSGIVPEVGRWYHAVVTVKSGSLKMYVNGVLRKTHSVTVEACNSNLRVGSINGGNHTLGDLDEVAIYKTELTAAQVRQHYLAGLGKTLTIDTIAPFAALNQSRTFDGIGGQTPYTFTVAGNAAGGSIDSASGLYNAPAVTTDVATPTTETFTITDANGNSDSVSISIVFLPSSAGGLRMWLDPMIMRAAVDNTAVGATVDISGNNLFFIQPVALNQPLFRVPSAAGLPSGAFPALQFDGTDILRTTSTNSNTGAVSVFVVANRTAGQGLISHLDAGETAPTNANYDLRLNGGFVEFHHEHTGGVNETATSALAVPAAWSVFGGVRPTAATQATLYLDDTNSGLLAIGSATAPDGGAGLGANIRIGESNEVTNFQGMIAEAVIYHRELTTAEIAHLRCYFKLKYGFTYSIAGACP